MNELKHYIAEGEHDRQDFKFRIDDQKKIARTLAAFANTRGGRLLIGVKDNGKIVGINPEEEYHMIQGAADLFVKPPLKFESRIWQEGFRLVLEISVEADEERPYQAKDELGKWRSYLRFEDHTLLANKIVRKVWGFQRKGIDRPQSFGEEESRMLEIMEQRDSWTLSQLYRHSGMSQKQVDHFLSILVYWDVVEMKMNSEGSSYRLKETQ